MREFRPEKLPVPELPANLAAQIRSGIADLEIGAGQGLHAIQYCLENPTRRLLAIERTQEKFARLQGRCSRHPHLTNLIPLHADAISIVAHFIATKSLERVFLLYPNPYPKSKQRNLRWYNSPFLSCLREKMKDGGQLYLSTNLDWYAQEAQQSLVDTFGFELTAHTLVTDPTRAQTHFEKKYLERGETCRRLIFTKFESRPQR